MAIEKVLEFGFGLFKRDPKIVLPNVLNWIPSALLTLLILQGVSVMGKWATPQTFQQVLSNSPFFSQIINTILIYIVIAIPIVIASVIISLILTCVYSDITRQAYTKRKVILNQAFSVAKSKFLPLLWTYFLEFLIVALILGGLVGIGFVGGILGAILAIICGVIVVLLSVLFFYETPAIVILENESGLRAIKRSYRIARRNFWSLAIVILIVGVIVSIVNGALSSVPYVGLILSNVAGLLLNTWQSMIPAVFYYEYEKGREEV